MIINLSEIDKNYTKCISEFKTISQLYDAEEATWYSNACCNFLEDVCKSEQITFKEFVSGFKRLINSADAISLILNKKDKNLLKSQEKIIDSLIENFISPAAVSLISAAPSRSRSCVCGHRIARAAQSRMIAR